METQHLAVLSGSDISLPWPLFIFVWPSLSMSLMKKLKLREVEDWPVVTQLEAVDSGLSRGPHSWVPHLSNPITGSNGPVGPAEGVHEKRRSVSEPSAPSIRLGWL